MGMGIMKVYAEHANITVSSIEESVRFLSAAFPTFRQRGGGYLHGNEALGQWLHFGTDETYIALQQNRRATGQSGAAYESVGVNHIGFVVDDLDGLVERMERAGYPLSPMSAMTGHPHRRRAYFNDADGLEWEFVEYTSEDPAERNDYTA